MRISWKALSVSLLVLGTVGQFPRLAAAADKLPDHARWSYLYEFSRTMNLTAPNIKLTMSTGGSSVYAVINRGGKAIGAVLPENAATSVSGEIMAFHIARALGVGEIYQPGVYHKLSGANLDVFWSIIPTAPFKSALKEENRIRVLNDIEANPGGIHAVFKEFGAKPVSVDELVSANRLKETHVLPGSSAPFASFLHCQGPMPSQGVAIALNKGRSSELALAKELSSIFLIDALTQQWDRFSGGNLQTITVKGIVHFAGIDNGGTWGGTKWTQRLLSHVTRFDRKVAAQILQMDAFFTKGGTYQGIRTEAEFAKAMGVAVYPSAMKKFKQSLKLVAAHVRQYDGCYFN